MPKSAVTPEQLTNFGELLKHLRRRAGLTQRELAIAVGYSDGQISRLEQNQRVPDKASLTARFVPALALERESALVERLLALAAAARDEAPEPSAQANPTPPRHNLPLQLTSFVGREKEIAEVARLLTSQPGRAATSPPLKGEGKGWGVRLVTLTGAGGCGKTRLALRVADELVDSFPDGVWLVELASLADPALVPHTVAATFDVREGQLPVVEALGRYLGHKQILLVLDNCEHLIEACAQFVEALVRTCPNLRVLATSREALGVAGEVTYSVPPLSLPSLPLRPALDDYRQSEAVRLFTERVALVLPGYNLTLQNAPAVIQVCQRLDGIPLAIELAAARARVLNAEELAARLENRLQLLTGATRTANPRHQTLRASIDWSYEWLAEAERVLLQRLSVFAGGWTLEAAEAVGARASADLISTAAVLGILAQLASKSLVVVDQSEGRATRYHLLETVREYGLERLNNSGEALVTQRRHADYFLALSEELGPQLRSADRGIWLTQLQLERDNLRSALRWSFQNAPAVALRLVQALRWFWHLGGYISEGCDWTVKALTLTDVSKPSRERGKALGAAGSFAWVKGDYTSARSYYEQSVAALEHLGDRRGVGQVLIRLGRVAQYQGDFAAARAAGEQSVEIFREEGDKWALAFALSQLGAILQLQGDLATARSMLEQSAFMLREFDDKWTPQRALGQLGYLELQTGNFVAARRRFEEDLSMAQHNRDYWSIAWRLEGCAQAMIAQGEPVRAVRLFGSAEALLEIGGGYLDPMDRVGYRESVAAARAQLGDDAFAAWAEGRAMTLEQAVAYALNETG
jgi:non-specific serine/threonine protein kinase